jgi:predicted HicB family RNase H-like nuclease
MQILACSCCTILVPWFQRQLPWQDMEALFSELVAGKFNLRIPPGLHENLAMAAQAQGINLNSLAQQALEKSVSV